MTTVFKMIRDELGMSQISFADMLGVSFSTVNRWENSKTVPSRLAQNKLYESVRKNNIDVASYTVKGIIQEKETLEKESDRVFLYHGSKSGIRGKIRPISRDVCDFGRGFYMGTIPEQPLTLICNYDAPKFYIVSVDINGLDMIKIDPDINWAMVVAYYRKKMESIKGTEYYKKYQNFFKDTDMVIGSIANDRMFYVIERFFVGDITDVALVESLSALKLGKQYVAINQKACDHIKVEKEINISYLEFLCLKEAAELNRNTGFQLANEICRNKRREGLFFDEILEGVK